MDDQNMKVIEEQIVDFYFNLIVDYTNENKIFRHRKIDRKSRKIIIQILHDNRRTAKHIAKILRDDLNIVTSGCTIISYGEAIVEIDLTYEINAFISALRRNQSALILKQAIMNRLRNRLLSNNQKDIEIVQ